LSTTELITTRLFIGGDWVDPASGETAEASSPATGEVLGLTGVGDREDARRAIDAADAAFPAWSRLSPFDRVPFMQRIADQLEQRREQLAQVLALDQGRPIYAEGYDEVDETIAAFRMAAEDAVRIEGSLPASRYGKRVLLMRRALGPVGVITPWNWPYSMAAELVAPALASGNTVVWVPPPSTSLCTALMADAISAADLPPGVFNFVSGPGPVVGDEVAAHEKVAMIGFIGSVPTGRRVAERAAGKRLVLELGNNGPMVIMDGADLPRAVEASVVGCFAGAGQSCAAAERLLVHEPVRDAFVELLAEAIGEVRLGDPLARDTTMGPLNNEQVAAKMDRHVADAVERGAQLLAGGSRRPGQPTNLYWEPTLLDDVSLDSLTAREETFGPIAPVMPVSSLDEAIAVTNQIGYGLVAAIFTPDLAQGLEFADRVRAGSVHINETSNYFETHLPFGGAARSMSGVGRTGGRHIMEEMTELQTVTITS
jgi:acyl-CoA reductase-like NAD-dependent aldehyde dehydrogenase